MISTHDLYVDLRKTDLLIAELRHRLECQHRLIASLRTERVRAWRENLRARSMEKKISGLCAHREHIIGQIVARQGGHGEP
jgi:hypothetical protein